jgi:hypothetical protein
MWRFSHSSLLKVHPGQQLYQHLQRRYLSFHPLRVRVLPMLPHHSPFWPTVCRRACTLHTLFIPLTCMCRFLPLVSGHIPSWLTVIPTSAKDILCPFTHVRVQARLLIPTHSDPGQQLYIYIDNTPTSSFHPCAHAGFTFDPYPQSILANGLSKVAEYKHLSIHPCAYAGSATDPFPQSQDLYDKMDNT